MVDWSGLTPDLLGLITLGLGVTDLIRFGSVCKSWRSTASPPRRGGLLPWLLVYNTSDRESQLGNFCHEGVNLGVFSLYDRQVYWLELPEFVGTQICGSSSTGWLATVQDFSVIKLVHAFTRSQIQLPSLVPSWIPHRLRFIRRLDINKLVITSLNPVSSTRPDVVIAICGSFRILAMFRPTESETTAKKTWTFLGSSSAKFNDVICYKGRIYTVNVLGGVCVVDNLESSSPCLTVITERCDLGEKHYLVESSGELLMISRFMDVDLHGDYGLTCKTTGFKAFKLDFSGLKLVEVKSLGDRLVFVGYTSFSLSASDVPRCAGSNCVYFTYEPLRHMLESFSG